MLFQILSLYSIICERDKEKEKSKEKSKEKVYRVKAGNMG